MRIHCDHNNNNQFVIMASAPAAEQLNLKVKSQVLHG